MRLWIAGLVLLLSSVAQAQTVVVTPTSAAKFTASPDHNTTFNGTPTLTNYAVEFYLPTQVVAGVPTGAPVKTWNIGKPTPASDNTITTPALMPQLPALNTLYVGFVTAVGPGGVGRSSATSPFGAPGPPAAATGLLLVP